MVWNKKNGGAASLIEKEIKVYAQTSNEARGTTIRIRTVDWISGAKHYKQLEKREFFLDQQGELKMGKSKGMTLKDMTDVVKPNWNAIMVDLGSQLAEHYGQIASGPVDEPAAANLEANAHEF